MKKWKKNLLSFLTKTEKELTLNEIYLGCGKGKSKLNLLHALNLFEEKGMVKSNRKKSLLKLDFGNEETALSQQQSDIRFKAIPNADFFNITKGLDKKEVKK